MCSSDAGYDSGCPACIHAPQCLKFNMYLSRSTALVIGRRMLNRLQSTELYKSNAGEVEENVASREAGTKSSPSDIGTPRRKARSKAMAHAKEMRSARDRQFVVGRPSWPMDSGNTENRNIYVRGGRQETG
jgi:ATP-dependent helicase YprA (DUF1998 family)